MGGAATGLVLDEAGLAARTGEDVPNLLAILLGDALNTWKLDGRPTIAGCPSSARKSWLPSRCGPLDPSDQRSRFLPSRTVRDDGLGRAEQLRVAREQGETSPCFLCRPTLTDEYEERSIEVVAEVLGRATR